MKKRPNELAKRNKKDANLFNFFFFSLFFSSCAIFAHRASRKVHRKTLLYVSGLGMTVFIFIAAELVRRMEGSSVERNFLHAPRWSSMDINQNFHANATAIVSDMIHHHDNSTNNSRNDAYDVYDGNNEIYLFISILLYNTFAACGVMILPWTLISELYPIEVRNSILRCMVEMWQSEAATKVLSFRMNVL